MNFKKLISMLLSVACAFTFIAATPGIDLNALTTSDNAPIVTAELEGSVMGTITSDEVIQNGGFPKQTSKISSIQSLESQHYRAVNSALRSKLLTAWNSCAAQIDIRSMNIKLQDVADTYFAVLNANPQFFYITSGFSYNWNPSTQIVNYIVIKYNYNVSQIPSLVSKFNAKTDEILKQVNAGWSDVEKALFVHDYFATNCEYDTSYNNYNAYNVIVDGVAVCQGYALAYQHIMNKLNIPCKVVTTEQMNHAWNTIKVNGAWYYVDITWDDPVPDTLGYSRHVNFLKNEAYFKSDASGHYGTDWLVDSANAMGVVTNPPITISSGIIITVPFLISDADGIIIITAMFFATMTSPHRNLFPLTPLPTAGMHGEAQHSTTAHIRFHSS